MLPEKKKSYWVLISIFPLWLHTHSRNANLHNSVTNQLIFMILVSKVWLSGMLNPFQGLINWFANLNTVLRYPKQTGFNFDTCFYNKLGCKLLFGEKWPPEAIFKILVMEINKKPKLFFFHRIAPIYHRSTIFTFKCMFLWVSHLNKLFVTKKVLFSVGLKIQDGWQSWPLIAA